jgi:hypothetical protein
MVYLFLFYLKDILLVPLPPINGKFTSKIGLLEVLSTCGQRQSENNKIRTLASQE